MTGPTAFAPGGGDGGAGVRGEAARLVHRLEVGRQRLDAVLGPRDPAGDVGGSAQERPGIDDDEVRELLDPAIDRVARLAGIARSLADGGLSETSAEEAVRALAATQPSRRPR